MANFNPCCCIPLRMGCMLIAIGEIVLSIIAAGCTILGIVALAVVHNMQDDNAMEKVSERIQQSHPEVKNTEPTAIFGLLYTVLGLACVIYVLQVIFASLLIHGIRQERLRLLKLWMIFRASCLAFNVIFTIAYATMQQNGKTYGEIAIDVFSTYLGLYFLFVVYRLYCEISTTSHNKQRPKYNSNSKSMSG